MKYGETKRFVIVDSDMKSALKIQTLITRPSYNLELNLSFALVGYKTLLEAPSLARHVGKSLIVVLLVLSLNSNTHYTLCSSKKVAGQKMIAFLTALADESNIRVYDDSLIRLHPSHFKVMPPERNTCFREEPHKCKNLYFEGADATPFQDR